MPRMVELHWAGERASEAVKRATLLLNPRLISARRSGSRRGETRLRRRRSLPHFRSIPEPEPELLREQEDEDSFDRYLLGRDADVDEGSDIRGDEELLIGSKAWSDLVRALNLLQQRRMRRQRVAGVWAGASAVSCLNAYPAIGRSCAATSCSWLRSTRSLESPSSTASTPLTRTPSRSHRRSITLRCLCITAGETLCVRCW